MDRVNSLKDILDYIDIGITDNNHKDHYILYISIIHDFFLNWDGIDFGIRYDVLKQSNLMLTKLVNHENEVLRADWLKLRNIIIPALIKDDKDLTDDDRYFLKSDNKDEVKYKYNLPVFRHNSSE